MNEYIRVKYTLFSQSKSSKIGKSDFNFSPSVHRELIPNVDYMNGVGDMF